MGCSGGKQDIEASINEVRSNPAAGLPKLQASLDQAVKEASTKEKIPGIFELMPSAMEKLSVKDSKPILAACGVIELCVKVRTEGVQPPIEVEHLKQSQRNLALLLKAVQEQGAAKFNEIGTECDMSSKECKAIALAITALFKLELYASECKEELKKTGGIASAIKAMGRDDSGIKREAMASLALMLKSFLDGSPEHAESIIACGGTYTLLPYVDEPAKYGVPKEMWQHCRDVLQVCLKFGQGVTNKDDIQKALDK